MDHPEITAIEWCFGAGGNHLGLRRVLPNLRLVALSEIEAYAAANVVAKMEAGQLDGAPNWTDCRTFPCELFRDRIALFIASYPCQGESHAGKRLGAKDPRWLWPAVRRGVEEMRPLRCFFENVEGHISKGLRTVCRDLEALGYRVACGIFSAEEVGANHRRKRVFIMADAVRLRGSGWKRALRGRRGVCEVREELADSERIAESRDNEPLYARQLSDRPGLENGCGSMADSSFPRLQRSELIGACDHERNGADALGSVAEFRLPSFPPSPDDLDAWQRVLEIAPSLEPALCRMADGMAHRVDRLRLTGNGVVSECAGIAYVTLDGELAA